MAKKVYKKPEIKKVELKTSESVLTACKYPGTRGPWRPNCKGPGGSCRQVSPS